MRFVPGLRLLGVLLAGRLGRPSPSRAGGHRLPGHGGAGGGDGLGTAQGALHKGH